MNKRLTTIPFLAVAAVLFAGGMSTGMSALGSDETIPTDVRVLRARPAILAPAGDLEPGRKLRGAPPIAAAVADPTVAILRRAPGVAGA